MNLILHGIEAPNIIHTNTLTENLDRHPGERPLRHHPGQSAPFGGKERAEVQQNFPIKQRARPPTCSSMHFIKMLKAGGRAGVVIKNTFLSPTPTTPRVGLRKLLLETCDLHTILDCPGGTFLGAGVKTVVLFFDKGSAD